MITIPDDQRTALNGRFHAADSLCGYLEFLMIKPLLPASSRVCRGGATSP